MGPATSPNTAPPALTSGPTSNACSSATPSKPIRPTAGLRVESHYDLAMATEVSTVTLGSGLDLSYMEQGDPSGPALVLLPGPTDSLWSYQSVLERIPPSIRTVAVSQRGHGDSDRPPNGYQVGDFAADVVPLLDALRIERAVLARI